MEGTLIERIEGLDGITLLKDGSIATGDCFILIYDYEKKEIINRIEKRPTYSNRLLELKNGNIMIIDNLDLMIHERSPVLEPEEPDFPTLVSQLEGSNTCRYDWAGIIADAIELEDERICFIERNHPLRCAPKSWINFWSPSKNNLFSEPDETYPLEGDFLNCMEEFEEFIILGSVKGNIYFWSKEKKGVISSFSLCEGVIHQIFKISEMLLFKTEKQIIFWNYNKKEVVKKLEIDSFIEVLLEDSFWACSRKRYSFEGILLEEFPEDFDCLIRLENGNYLTSNLKNELKLWKTK